MPILNLTDREYRTLRTILSRTNRVRVTSGRHFALEKIAKTLRSIGGPMRRISIGEKHIEQLERLADMPPNRRPKMSTELEVLLDIFIGYVDRNKRYWDNMRLLGDKAYQFGGWMNRGDWYERGGRNEWLNHRLIDV